MAGTAPNKPKRSFSRGLIYFFVGLLALIGFSSVLGKFMSDDLDSGKEKIALVEVTGMISDSSEVVNQLSQYGRNKSIKGIILRIDSPGGAVAPSQEIYDEVLRTRAKNKTVYASMGSLAASGGYYIAAAADRIFANPGTLTGSIGVIMAFSNAEELIHKIGLKPEVVKSGKFKDTGSPARKMSKEERGYLQRVVNDVHQQFVEAVAKGRNLKIPEARKLADGRIYTGRQAFKLKMVDQIGSLEDAIASLSEVLGIRGRPKIVKESKKQSFMEWFMGNNAVAENIKSALWPARFPHLQYLWLPG